MVLLAFYRYIRFFHESRIFSENVNGQISNLIKQKVLLFNNCLKLEWVEKNSKGYRGYPLKVVVHYTPQSKL